MIVTMQGKRRDDLLPLLCPPHTVTFSNHHHSFLPEYQIFLLQQLNTYHITAQVRGLHSAQCISCHRLWLPRPSRRPQWGWWQCKHPCYHHCWLREWQKDIAIFLFAKLTTAKKACQFVTKKDMPDSSIGDTLLILPSGSNLKLFWVRQQSHSHAFREVFWFWKYPKKSFRERTSLNLSLFSDWIAAYLFISSILTFCSKIQMKSRHSHFLHCLLKF